MSRVGSKPLGPILNADRLCVSGGHTTSDCRVVDGNDGSQVLQLGISEDAATIRSARFACTALLSSPFRQVFTVWHIIGAMHLPCPHIARPTADLGGLLRAFGHAGDGE